MRAVNLTKLESRPTKTGLGPVHVLHRHRGQPGARPARSAAAITALEQQGVARVTFLGLLPRRRRSRLESRGLGVRDGCPEHAARSPTPTSEEPWPQQVLVLNATYEPINVCSLQRAVVLVLKNKAEVLERAARKLRSATASHACPLVIRLRLLRARAAPRVAQDLAPRRVRPRRLRVPVLRRAART